LGLRSKEPILNEPVIELKRVSKKFPGVLALDEVDFELEKGEIRALVGKNGAGKSTLIKMITGVYAFDSGEYRLEGEALSNISAYSMHTRGIRAIYQENDLIPFFTVGQSVLLNNEMVKGGVFLDRKAIHEKARVVLKDVLDIDIDPYTLVNDLSVAQKQMVQIAKALLDEPKVLIFDEPTASLSSTEIDKLFAIIQGLKKKNVSVIYISHRLEEVFEIAESVTVMRDGRKIVDALLKTLSEEALIKHISGEESSVQRYPRSAPVDPNDKALVVHGLRYSFLKDIDIELRRGEILGVFGAEGAGQPLLAQSLYGLSHATYVEYLIDGQKARIKRPIDAIRYGIGYVPRDRKGEGLVIDFDVKENVTLASMKDFSRRQFIQRRKEAAASDEMIRKLSIKTPSSATIVRTLSGGNQQKVVIARWLTINPKILILDYPTAGIDVHAKEEVYGILRDLSEKKTSILLITPEYEEIRALCDRVVVMRDGQVVAVEDVSGISEEILMSFAIGTRGAELLEGRRR